MSTPKSKRAALRKVDARTADFKEWFVAQYGDLPGDLVALRKKLEEHEASHRMTQNEFDKALRIHALWDAAMKGWMAGQTQGKAKK